MFRDRAGPKSGPRKDHVSKLQESGRRPSLPQRADLALSTVRSRRPIPPFQHQLTREKTGPDVIVAFDGPDDEYNPRNWRFSKKVITTLCYGLTTMGVTFASSVYSPAVGVVANEFHVSRTVSILGISFMLFGFGLGPLLWAPLSEVYGRKPAVLIPYFICACFTFATAASKDIQSVLITRFFAGFFGSAPITNTGGVLGDIWHAKHRGAAIVGYALSVVGGPTVGPIVGGAIVQSSLSWRWTEIVTGIYMMAILVIDVIVLDETSKPTLLVYKARRLRLESGNWALHAKHEEWDITLRELGNKYLIRPFEMLFTPICFLLSLYSSFVYAILYGELAAFPIEFQQERGWDLVVGSLPFLALLIGILIGAVVNLANQKYYMKRFNANNCRPVPEARLPPMMIGSLSLPTGLFLFAWTSSRNSPWELTCLGAIFIGLGFFTIFQASLNYLIDTFQQTGASAIAANTFLRSALGGALPIVMAPMLHNLGINWGISIFGFLAVAMIPIPYLFFVYGKRIRAKGYWSRGSL
ncbi:MFS general substrate transporter [Trichodelitschia bisporula]|uniref:MFS general substrate transporter n=1 Tax=Trichodelitschia bisporula TaxID=703511 RepID=A0A6G1I0Q7_9PEZI|nr:MFS general substrate transporter [Trichodelitschia bisporula]